MMQRRLKVHVLQHVAFEGLGSIAQWLEKRAANVSYTRFFDDPTLPEPNCFDLIIIMGGPMSVNQETQFRWLCPEKQFIREAVKGGIPVLGICLGAQLIASAFGARIYPNPQKEIGWYPIEAECNSLNTFCFPNTCTVFHWHGETFDLPSGAVRLARTIACDNQAFQLARHVIGLQFHLEATPESVQAMIEHCSDELVTKPYIQTKSEICSVPTTVYSKINGLMDDILVYLTGAKGSLA